jgi:hypothetical protein
MDQSTQAVEVVVHIMVVALPLVAQVVLVGAAMLLLTSMVCLAQQLVPEVPTQVVVVQVEDTHLVHIKRRAQVARVWLS